MLLYRTGTQSAGGSLTNRVGQMNGWMQSLRRRCFMTSDHDQLQLILRCLPWLANQIYTDHKTRINNATGAPEAPPSLSDSPEILRTLRHRLSVDIITLVAVIVINIVFEIIAVKFGPVIVIAGPDVILMSVASALDSRIRLASYRLNRRANLFIVRMLIRHSKISVHNSIH